MTRQALRSLSVAALALLGCEIPESPGESAGDRHALDGEPRLIIGAAPDTPPPGSDGVELLEVGFRDDSGQVTPIDLQGPFLAALAWGAHAIVVDQHHELWSVAPQGRRRQLGQDVFGTPALSDDGATLAWVELRERLGEVRVREAKGGPRVVARDLQSAGALRFSPDGAQLLLVGSRLGGVAGLSVVDLDDPGAPPRCLTNCSLRTGRPWDAPLIPSPPTPSSLEFSDDHLSWAVDDRQFTVRYRGGGSS